MLATRPRFGKGLSYLGVGKGHELLVHETMSVELPVSARWETSMLHPTVERRVADNSSPRSENSHARSCRPRIRDDFAAFDLVIEGDK